MSMCMAGNIYTYIGQYFARKVGSAIETTCLVYLILSLKLDIVCIYSIAKDGKPFPALRVILPCGQC